MATIKHISVIIIACAVGEMYGIIVGGVKDRWEFLLIGDPVIQMSEAEHEALTGTGLHVARIVVFLLPVAQWLFLLKCGS